MKRYQAKRHHFVPQLYMRNFACDTGRKFINVHVIKSSLTIPVTCIKEQCYKWRLYGKTDEIEDALQRYESPLAELLRRIIAESRIVVSSREDMERLYDFVALQMLRTVESAARMSEAMDTMDAHIEQFAPVERKRPPESDSLTSYSLSSLRAWSMVSNMICDLGVRLIINKTATNLITSDNPVVKYNQYCHGVQGYTTTGMPARGLQIFLPISPKHLLLFCDTNVYRINGHGIPVISTANPDDIAALNLLQAANAGKILLFSGADDLLNVEATARRAKRHRKARAPQIIELVADDAPERKSLLHLCWPNLEIGLNLSFMSVKKQARKATLEERINRFRDANPYGAYVNQMRDNPRGIFRRYRSPRPGEGKLPRAGGV